MSKQRELFDKKTYTVSDVIKGWQKMLDTIGKETNRLQIKATMKKHEEENKNGL